jgi:hypothetical protein
VCSTGVGNSVGSGSTTSGSSVPPNSSVPGTSSSEMEGRVIKDLFFVSSSKEYGCM